MEEIDLTLLEKLIFGIVDPYIYAFSTNTVPNYLKVGDTYRPVSIRLNEWKRFFPNLKKEFEDKAKVDDETFFRDYEVHKYLEFNKKERHQSDDEVHNSKEFFKDTNPKDIEEGIEHIKDDFIKNSGLYNFYKFSNSRIPISFSYLRTDEYEPRPNQQETINNFKTAVDNGRNHLLMYAVMRFGKSFTSMCCAIEMNAKAVVVVSGKADVVDEWKRTIEKHKKFYEYSFLSGYDLQKNDKSIYEVLSNTDKRFPSKVVIFLTLQDLQGNLIKEKHQELFGSKIELLIVDETHFGARAEKYGAVLLESKAEDSESGSLEDLHKQVKTLNAKIKLHLSGTPYRILMNSEFEKEDIIAFYQFSDIIEDKRSWDIENLNNDDVSEWDNPYYGFPEMIRFAFNPTKSAQKIINNLKADGFTTSFSALFEPKSIDKKIDSYHKEFKHKIEVLEFLQIIDGSKNEQGILGFLDYDKIKKGKMCHHIVFVLPYKASCDAMEDLVKNNRNIFKNISEYEIINIAGHETPKSYKALKGIKEKIKECENINVRTITLTVNRMLTGSTVEEWDTMIFLKDTSSPQEYDQAVFRLQNQYIKYLLDENGKIIKYNMKPQTLLVDFCPDRMFRLQETRSQIFNINSDKKGNENLEYRLKKELEISPIISFNKDKIKQVTPEDILKELQEYSAQRSVIDEVGEIPIDYNLKDDDEIVTLINAQEKIDNKGGLSIGAYSGENTDYDEPQLKETPLSKHPESPLNLSFIEDDYKKKFATFYARLLFYAFLTNSETHSLQDIINSITPKSENERIARNLGIDSLNILMLIRKKINWVALSRLDYKIKNINDLANDNSLPPIQRVQSAINKFSRLSSSEVITPNHIANDMINMIHTNELFGIIENNGRILDIASKSAEFILSLYQILEKQSSKWSLKHLVYAVPTSSWSYEFTRKIYNILDFDVNNIATKFNSYDLLKVKRIKNGKETKELDYEKISNLLNQEKDFNKIKLTDEIKGETKMKFDIIIGNPPYQDDGGSGGNNDAPIYQYFAQLANTLAVKYSSMIIKAGWFSAGRENLLGSFRKEMIANSHLQHMVVYPESSEVFTKNVEIKGGVCYYLINKDYNGSCQYKKIQNGEIETAIMRLNSHDIIIRDPKVAVIVDKVLIDSNIERVESIVSSDTPFGISSNPRSSKKTPFSVYETSSLEHNTLLYHIENQKRKIEYVERDRIKKNIADIDKDKVFIMGTGGSGTDKDIIGKPEIAPKNSVCSQSFLYAAFESEIEAQNFMKYLKTRFFRVLVSAIKITQSAPNRVYKFVPLLDFKNDNESIDWSKSIGEIDEQLYDKYHLDEDDRSYIKKIIAEMK